MRAYAKDLAEEMVRQMPQLVVSRMTKTLRPGKVLLDWSQNTAAKTTISPYSLRGRRTPTVAAPRSWAELDRPGKLRQRRFDEVLELAGKWRRPAGRPFPGRPAGPHRGLELG